MKITANAKLNRYVAKNLSLELKEGTDRNFSVRDLTLTLEEQALIYRYTEGGYASLNETLRANNGHYMPEYGRFLADALAKLPDFEDIVYRAADLSTYQLKKYEAANEKNVILVEPSFISTSKSK